MKKIEINEIIDILGIEAEFSKDHEHYFFNNVKPINQSDEYSLTWLSSSRKDKIELLELSNSKIVICDDFSDFINHHPAKLFIKVINPKIVFLRIVKKYFTKPQTYGIHKTAIISPLAKIHPKSYIGANCVIEDVEIGENSYIFSNCFLGNNTIIKKNVTIKSGAVLGGDGFGYSKNENGEFEKFPHVGGIIINNNVDIGSNTCIDKGTLGNTIIKEGAKIDNLVHIAHNVVIGENTTVIANSMIAGSTIIGNNTWISPSVCIRDGVTIGSNVIIGLASLVTKNIPDNEVWIGLPAKKIKNNK